MTGNLRRFPPSTITTMPSLIIIIALGVAGWLIYKLYYKSLLAQGRAGKIKILLIVLGIIFILMAATGRAHGLFAVIGAAMTQVMRLSPLLFRYLPMLQRMMRANKVANPSAGQTSSVTSRFLAMTLNHDDGSIDGEIIDGPHAGRSLSSLNISELKSLLANYANSDGESYRLLSAYVQRVYGDDEAFAQSAGGNAQPPVADGSMTLEEARAVLGVDEDAGRDQIVDAHRRLMSKMHPDKGGSTYLATKINTAKDLLIDNLA